MRGGEASRHDILPKKYATAGRRHRVAEGSQEKPEIVYLHEPRNVEDDNIDVVVRLPNGENRTVTFFTIKNLVTLMESHRSTGECLGGTYFWARDLVIVKDMRRETIDSTIVEMVENGEYAQAFGIGDTE
jgi:hypothetical protein